MTTDVLDQLLPHWALHFAAFFMGACFVATLLIRVIPTPPEIDWKPWAVIYKTVERFSLVRKDWKVGGPVS